MGLRKILGVAGVWLLGAGMLVQAQTCTTQAKMSAAQRDAVSDAALAVGKAIQGGEGPRVRALYAANVPHDAEGTDYLVRSTATRLSGSTLRVTQIYLLDASGRKDTTGSADFSCPLNGSTSETDFSIAGLPAGQFAFAMVEAGGGAQPSVLSLLLEQVSGAWQLAGFVAHERTVGGHDGLWYWTTARERAVAKQPWAAYLLFGEAYALLQPASYVDSSHLDKLAAERTAAAPPELANGVSTETPYVLTAKAGSFAFTDVSTAGSDGGQRLLLTLHMRAESTADAVAARARNLAAATAFVDAHPEVRAVVASVTVFADVAGQLPFATQHAIAELP